jgi:putative CocE/NonD family hydrolase
VKNTLMVAMRDGIRLATSLHLPDGPGPFPVVLERTPYGRDDISRSEITAANPVPSTRADLAKTFTDAGYAVVFQDNRGRHDSEGLFVKYLSDGEDGYDCCTWIMAQSWCDGRICTMGLSYAAHTQGALGCAGAPGIVAQVLDSGGFSNAWTGGIRQFGAFELKQATWAHKQALLSPEALADPIMHAALEAEDIRDWFTRMPWKPGHSPLRHHPAYEAYLFDQWRHGAFGPFWQQLGIWAEGFYSHYVQASCVHMSSWYDPYSLTAATNYRGLKSRGPQRLILGPWTHGNRSQTIFGDVDFGPNATIDSWAGDWRAYRLQHFNNVIHGTENPEPPVRVFVMGGGTGRKTEAGHLDHGGRWISLEDWPAPQAKLVRHHPQQDGSLAPTPGTGTLSYDYDPANPVPTIGGNLTSLEPVASGGAYNQVESADFFGCQPPYLPLASRPDILVFQTQPLTQDTEIVGEIACTLTVSTDAPDTDFTAKLIDVHPPSKDYPAGYAMILTDGIVRLRYAEDPTQERFRTPGEKVTITVVLYPTANRFLAGHRIRLDISSSNFPKFDVNPNTAEPDGAAMRKRIAGNTVHLAESWIDLPTLP